MREKEDQVILVDKNDNQIGRCGKLKAHQLGLLHRAISVFIFSPKGDWLLQQRAEGKYHSGGLWSNSCCSHPRPAEPAAAAAHRRLREEMGFDCDLKEAYSFIYRTVFDNGLIEHEYDHVFIGTSTAKPHPDSAEVANWQWIAPEALAQDLRRHPQHYTYWFRFSFATIIKTSF